MLFLLLGYLAWQGASSLSLSFFTHLPAPVGEIGGGMANAIVGSVKLLVCAALVGMPIGFLGGVYLAEYGRGSIAASVRFAADVLNGVPSIVIGVTVYALIVLPAGHFSTLAGGVALGLIMIPVTLRATEEFLRLVPDSLREASLALGAPQWVTIVRVVIPAGQAGNRRRHPAVAGARGGRDRAAPLHRVRQSLLERGVARADRVAAGHDLHLRHLALRRLAPSGVGGGPHAARDGPRRQRPGSRGVAARHRLG